MGEKQNIITLQNKQKWRLLSSLECKPQYGDLHTDVAAEISLVLDTTPNSFKGKNIRTQIKKKKCKNNILRGS